MSTQATTPYMQVHHFNHHPRLSAYKHCWYCGNILTRKHRTNDHVVPKCLGGSVFVFACRSCNELKAAMSVEEFRQYLYGDEPVPFYGELRKFEAFQ